MAVSHAKEKARNFKGLVFFVKLLTSARGRLGWCSATRNMVVAETAAWYRDENERKGV